ncbi:kirola-like [Olea europaea subsp. europaea]|uniref:Kirola-like n=1 Tax=Olea europaea subsp. europaea TaxID=158383 RepID=A0A8S0V949_OLEEU|nr:kirola-like [Olea europaea subsp. europaea]
MGRKGKLTAQIEMRSGGDVFHDLFRYTPHQIPKISPTTIQGCDLHQGEWENYGKPEVAKEVIEPIDEEKRSVTFKLIEGDLKKVLKAFKINFHVEIDGDTDLITWTLEYEKLNDDVKDPLTL